MNNKEKKILFCLIFIFVTLIGMIAAVNVMVAKFGIMMMMSIYMVVWLMLLCLYIICIKLLNTK